MKLPYMAAPGVIQKILDKIQEARRPERFTQDYLETKLGHSGGSARPIIPLLKRMEFLSADGTPSTLYDQFRNPSTKGAALAAGVRNAYRELFDRNQFADSLSREKLTNLVREMTGLEKTSRVVQLIVATFFALKAEADFEVSGGEDEEGVTSLVESPDPEQRTEKRPAQDSGLPVDFRVG